MLRMTENTFLKKKVLLSFLSMSQSIVSAESTCTIFHVTLRIGWHTRRKKISVDENKTDNGLLTPDKVPKCIVSICFSGRKIPIKLWPDTFTHATGLNWIYVSFYLTYQIFVPISDKSVGINNHKCELRPGQWSNKCYSEVNVEREKKGDRGPGINANQE